MMAVLKLNADDIPEWSVYDEIYLVRRYNGELSPKELTEAIWEDLAMALLCQQPMRNNPQNGSESV